MFKSQIRTISDYPKAGIKFRDITTLLQDGKSYKKMLDLLVSRYSTENIDKIAVIEARGFIIGAPLAYALGVGLVPIRKSGKLPAATFKQNYALEYGEDSVEIHQDALAFGDRVLLVDDLLATGGTAAAALALIQTCGAELVEAAFVIELNGLGGRQLLEKKQGSVFSLMLFNED